MPLVVCSDCGKEISDRAPNCPNCGAPNELFQSNTQLSTTGGNQRSCPQCTTVMNVGRRMLLALFVTLLALVTLFLSVPFSYNVILMILERGSSGVKWEIAGPVLLVPVMGLYLLSRGIRYSQPHLICPKCRKELWS